MKIIETNGASIPAIGLGTFTLEGAQCADMVARAIEAGYRHIDTARMYANEREVGQGIRASGIERSALFVTTKVWWTDIGGEDLVPSAEAALEALGLDAVDLLLIHWPNREVPLESSIGALNAAKEQGLTRSIGVANFTSSMFDEAAAMSTAPLVCNQVEYHPFLSQEAVLGACARHEAALVAYSPLGRGGDILSNSAVREAAERHGKTPAQIVLRWEIEQDKVAAIPRTSKAERLAENIDIFDFELTEAEHDALTALTTRRARLVNPAFAPNWDRT
ncbi:aldo/keto reductase [Mangrovibrevibacter kandeliae]|uniref:aldo/keto reductase n=1 Tax=Mangrovibrevibacter kandeliae TaxID=2968473 RepID=UPI0021175D46|nr:aldo/keto reductase [Aurantimonas sp. CSK15Z-1]MCQ8782475.1 aldo/keto reductase [Aurantimonas sp. CSK15Z-1]